MLGQNQHFGMIANDHTRKPDWNMVACRPPFMPCGNFRARCGAIVANLYRDGGVILFVNVLEVLGSRGSQQYPECGPEC